MRKGPLLALALVTACAAAPAGNVEVELGEFWISTDRAVLAAGVVDLAVHNAGSYGHTVVITTEAGDVVVASEVIPPGAGADMAVSLAPGAYVLTCRIVNGLDDGTVIDHYQQGMVAKVKVAGSTR